MTYNAAGRTGYESNCLRYMINSTVRVAWLIVWIRDKVGIERMSEQELLYWRVVQNLDASGPSQSAL
jgi:hypothetical protein